MKPAPFAHLAIAAALVLLAVPTFYGIFSANVFIPIATKLTDHSERDIINKEMTAEGIMAIQQGDVMQKVTVAEEPDSAKPA